MSTTTTIAGEGDTDVAEDVDTVETEEENDVVGDTGGGGGGGGRADGGSILDAEPRISVPRS